MNARIRICMKVSRSLRYRSTSLVKSSPVKSIYWCIVLQKYNEQKLVSGLRPDLGHFWLNVDQIIQYKEFVKEGRPDTKKPQLVW
jgi:hypothetical protein